MTVVDVGTPPAHLLGRDNHFIRFHGFSSKLLAVKGQPIISSDFTSFGHEWSLTVYPSGRSDSSNGMISAFLNHESPGLGHVRITFVLMIKDHYGQSVVHTKTTKSFPLESHLEKSHWGWPNFTSRSEATAALVQDTLTIEVGMELLEPTSLPSLPFIPMNPASNALHMFLGEPPNIVFEAGGNQKRRSTRSSLDPTIVEFRAHRSVIEKCAPQLLKIVSREKGSDVERVSIPTAKPEVFCHLLRYVYGGEVPTAALQDYSKEIIEAASHYAMPQLKLTAEAWYVHTVQIGDDNVAEHLIFANKHTLALLKEAAVAFILASEYEIDNLPEEAQKGLGGDIQRANNKNGDGFSKMCVNELRQMLEEKGLGIGGSKKQIIGALREAAKSDEAAECAANLGKMKV